MTVAKRTRHGDAAVATGLLGLALVLGGGSPISPIQRTIVELAGVFTLCWFFTRGWRAPRGHAVTVGLAIAAALVILVIFQIMPLPPGLWRRLPGRDAAADVLDILGAGQTWRPLSLDPAATREAGYFLIPPLAMFVATLHLGHDARSRLVLMIVVAAVLSAVLVMIQAQGAMWLTLYDAAHATKGKGIFANKNHNAALLVLAIPLTAMLGSGHARLRRSATQRAIPLVLIVFLAVAVLGCLSRAGIALLPIALLSCIPLLGGWVMVRRHWKIAVAVVLALIVVLVLIAQSSIVKETLDRFGASQEGRYVFWPDVVATIRQFLPWGSGLGTFVPVFRMNESLVAVHQTYTNHAHSDVMEIALEAGIPGLLILLAFLVWFAITAWNGIRDRINTPELAPVFAPVVGISLLLAASLVDYPLRTLLLACVLAVLAAMIASPDRVQRKALSGSGDGSRQTGGPRRQD